MSDAKVFATLVNPNGSDFGITQSKVILNEKSGGLFTRDIYGQVRQIGGGSFSADSITFPSLGAAPFQLIVTGSTFNGVFDPQLILAYNYNRAVTTEPSLHLIVEGHYYDGADHWSEINLDYTSLDGLTQRRFFGFQVNRTTSLATWAFAGNSIRLESVINQGEITIEPSLGKWTRSVADGTGSTPAIATALLNSTTGTSAVCPAIQFGAGSTSAAAQIYAKRLVGSGGRLFFRSADTSGTLQDRFEINEAGHMVAAGVGTEILLGTGTTVSASGYSGLSASGTTGGLIDLRVSNTSEGRMYANASGGLFIQNTQGRSITLQTGDGANAEVVITHTASAVNTLTLTGGATGAPAVVAIGASGSSTDVDIAITPKGAGVLKFGTTTAKGAEAFASYITIKDAGGTSRKVMVCA